MIKKWRVNYPSPVGEDRRNVYIYLPSTYQYEEDRRYPVLYMFDGQNVFFDRDASYGKSWGMGQYLDYTNAQIIVVAVGCNTKGNLRLNEYSPYDFSAYDVGDIEGFGHNTIMWYVKWLKPQIDKKYRTISDREHTFIGGSSMGGLMSIYALFKFNTYFSRAMALSPSVWTNPEKIKWLIRKSKIDDETIIYTDYGTDEMADRENADKVFLMLTSELQKKGVAVTSRIVPWGVHSEANWEKQLPFALGTVLYDC